MTTSVSGPDVRPDLSRSPRSSAVAEEVGRAAAQVVGLGTHLGATLDWATRMGRIVPLPGHGRTWERWSALATAAAHDVGAARVLEPHLDALAILAEARASGELEDDALAPLGADEESAWGVYAAEGAEPLRARRDADDRWTLTGTKTWCSLARDLSHALVTAWVDATTRRLFAVSLRDPSVTAHPGPWVARGLRGIVSAPVEFAETPAVAVGADEWYLHRPGFAWGGIGVAAVWWGGVHPVLDAVRSAAARERADQVAFMLLGDADTAVWAARTVLGDAAHRIDHEDAGDPRLLAERVRAVVASSVEHVLTIADQALGPAPLTTDEAYARRTGDLRLYVRQHHAHRDLVRIGRRVVGG